MDGSVAKKWVPIWKGETCPSPQLIRSNGDTIQATLSCGVCAGISATYGPELDKRCQPHLKPTNRSWRVDETYIQVKGHERFLYRAVDSTGQTIDFLFTAKRARAAARRFFQRGLANPGHSIPRVINVDKNRSYAAAVDELKKDGTIRRRCKLRQCQYLNNVVEQDHRNAKRRTWLAKGYGSVATAWRTLRGIEAMDMVRKGRVRRAGKGDVVAQVKFITSYSASPRKVRLT